MAAKQTEVSLPKRGREGFCGTGIPKQQRPEQPPEELMAAKQTEVSLPKRGREGFCGTGIRKESKKWYISIRTTVTTSYWM